MLDELQERIRQLKEDVEQNEENKIRLHEALFILTMYKEHLDKEREKLHYLYDY